MPNILSMAIPNGGLRHPIIGRQLKAEGLLPGSPDLVFALPHGKTFWMEMKIGAAKRLKDGGLSDAQIGVHYRLQKNEHDIATVYSVEEALHMLADRGLLK